MGGKAVEGGRLMREDYYQLLDVSPAATPQELKAAYYRQAKRYHPDHNVGQPAAEERFKLVAEAYRTLGVPERRREYDNWLRLHRLCPGASELESLASTRRVRPFHYSSRRAHERQERRMGHAPERPRARRLYRSLPFAREGKVNLWFLIGVYAFILINILPMFFRHMFSSHAPVVKHAVAAAEEKPDEAEVRRRVLALEETLEQKATSGDARAQYQLGLYLFNKSSRGRGEGNESSLLRRAASEGFRNRAVRWLQQSAGQGYAPALRLLNRLQASVPASSCAS